MICIIVNTCEYCYNTVSGLSENVANTIQKDLAEEVCINPSPPALLLISSRPALSCR